MYYSFKIGRKDTIIILIDNTLSVSLQQIKYTQEKRSIT